MTRGFTSDQPSRRVVFGAGVIERLAEEVERLGARRALVLSTPGRQATAEEAARSLGGASAGVFAEAAMHVPIETARRALETAARRDADCCIALGGGSTIGLGKAIARETTLPVVAVPTTLSGSEMTAIYGFTEGGVKKTGRDPKVRPKTVLYDPVLTLTLPPHLAGPSGMNALAHAVEALYAHDLTPVISLIAREAIGALRRSLPAVVSQPAQLEARSDALYGAWLAGMALDGTSMGLHHRLCHVLGGSFGLPHADVHTAILPHAAAFNREAAPDAMRAAAGALGADDAAHALYDLAVRIGARVALAELGMAYEGLDRAARIATETPYPNPRPVEYQGVRQLLEHAYHGTRPD